MIGRQGEPAQRPIARFVAIGAHHEILGHGAEQVLPAIAETCWSTAAAQAGCPADLRPTARAPRGSPPSPLARQHAFARFAPQRPVLAFDAPRSPSSATILPGKRLLLPMNSAVNSVVGEPYISCGVPCCSIFAVIEQQDAIGDGHRLVLIVSHHQRRQAKLDDRSRRNTRASSRSLASRLDSGSSSRITGGL